MRIVLAALILVALGGCSEPLEFADWTIPVAEGVRVVEHPYTSEGERTESVGLVEDLVLGLDENDPQQRFYGLRDVDADADGNLWVLDGGNHRVQVFDREGRFARSFGREGQGPGELTRPSWLIVAGDRVVIEADSARLSVFDLDGNHVADAAVRDVRGLDTAFGRTDRTLYASHTEFDPEVLAAGTSGDVPTQFRVSRFDLNAGQLREFFALDSIVIFMSSASDRRPASVARPFASYAAGPDGDLYGITATEYQVLAFDRDAEPKWAMRVAYAPEGLSEEIIERAIESARRRRPETNRSDLIWPDRLPALSHIAVDGHGHVYVYPYFDRGEELEERPVDVYSPDGELLFSGMILDRQWRRAQGDFVYAAGSDRVTGELLVWRWRLEEPF
jgi:hypothetical protein